MSNIITKINKSENLRLFKEKEALFTQLEEKYTKNVDLNYTVKTGDEVIVYNMVKKGQKLNCYQIAQGIVCQSKKSIKVFQQKSKNGDYFFLNIRANHPNIFFKVISSNKKPSRAVLKIKHLQRI